MHYRLSTVKSIKKAQGKIEVVIIWCFEQKSLHRIGPVNLKILVLNFINIKKIN